MKYAGLVSSHAAVGMAAALAALVALPVSVSAQAVIGYRRPSAQGQSTPSTPAQSVSTPSAPARSESLFARPNGPTPSMSITTNSSIFRSQRPSGPVFVTPDPSERNYDFRHQDSWHQPSLPPIGPANGFFTHPIPPIGPANGFFNSTGVSNPVFPNGSDVRLTTPYGPQETYGSQEGSRWRYHDNDNWRYHDNGGYSNGSAYSQSIIVNAPPLLGGYYYGSYCDNAVTSYTYPSVYCTYAGFPRYLYNPTVVVISQPYIPAYETTFLPFYTPSYPVTYNQNNYYVTNEERAQDLEAGGDRAKAALRHAYPADSYQAAFGDIARAWMDDAVKPLRKHVRDNDTRVSVFLDKKYSYSIASSDFVQITRDALDRLNTVSFDFTRLRKAKNGDVTAYGIHVYRTGTTDSKDDASGDTVPFDGSGTDTVTNSSKSVEKTVYVSYTLHLHDTQWYIISVDSSDQPLVPAQ